MITIVHKSKQYITFFIKLLVVSLAFYIIWSRLTQNDKMTFDQFYDLLLHKFTLAWILLMFFLSFANRFLEILKWQNLVLTFQEISLFTSTKQVLAALTAGLFTPNGLGEYAGKAFYYEKSKTKLIIFLNLVCNGIQMFWTVFFGLIGLFVLNYWLLFFGILLTIVLVLSFAFLIKTTQIKGYSIALLFQKLHEIPRKTHLKNAVLGFLRYLTFTHQYYFLLLLFDVNLPYVEVMATLTAVYFIASSLPSFQFLDFMVKGGVAVYFFSKLGVDEYIVVFISLFIWLFNVVFPVLIGSYFVWTFKPKSS